ncbi:MAG: hypothetical protein KQA41_03340 [Candidatus Aenigmarchaeota archaeon]|nr:hypothetical protein [Candidatus Aenigmarchaeota archaeon]MBU5689231.1 hypothetical protein [Candidatus Aenigmarchaeota archaeon]
MRILVVLLIFILIVLLVLFPFKNNCIDLTKCNQDDWECICSHIKDENICKKFSDCMWTNFHSNEYYCMATFCMIYNKTECEKHYRCVWGFDENGGYEICEDRQI